jgi:hypothetical protein
MPVDMQLGRLHGLMAPLFDSTEGSLLRRLPLKAINLWHRTVNRRQVEFNRRTVALLASIMEREEDHWAKADDAHARAAAALTRADGALKRAQASVEAAESNRDLVHRLADEIHGLHRWVQQLHENEQEFSDRAAYIDRRINELMLQARELKDPAASDLEATETRVVDPERVERLRAEPGGPRLNVGCGSDIRDAYINVDGRELPGVDVVADVRRLPFEPGTVAELFSSHTIEHFREHQLRTAILPHWVALLRPGGQLRVLCPDLDGLLSRVQDASMGLEELRLYLYGAQDYVGNDHYASYNADLLTRVLEEQGLIDIEVVATDRLANGCPEIELVGSKPA